MSVVIPAVDLSAAMVTSTGAVSWQSVVPQSYGAAGNTPAHLLIYNESGCGLQIQMATGEQIFIPAGGWLPQTLDPSCLSFTYTVVYVLSNPLVSSLVMVWYSPGEAPPNVPILGN